MAQLDKLIRINIDYENSLVKINEVEVALTDLARAEELLSKTIISSSESRVRSEAQIQKEISALKQEQKSVAETTVQYGQFTAQIKQLELELEVLRGTAVKTADGIVTLKEQSEKAASAQKELAKQTALAQKEAAEQSEQARISQEKLNNTFIVANKSIAPESINSLRDQIRFTKALADSVDKSSFEYIQHIRTLERLNAELKKYEGNNALVSSSSDRLRNSSGLASQTIVELGRTISDSNYGFTAIANNLSQLSYYFVTLVKDSNGVGAALKNLGKQMLGAGGIVIGLQLLITFIEKYSLKQREAKQATESLTKSLAGVDGQIAVMQSYANILNDTNSSLDAQKFALKKLKDEGYDPLIKKTEEFLEAKKKLLIFDATQKAIQEELSAAIAQERILKKRKEDLDAFVAAAGGQFVLPAGAAVPGAGLVGAGTEAGGAFVAGKESETAQKDIDKSLKQQKSFNEEITALQKQLVKDLEGNSYFDALLGLSNKEAKEKRLKSFKSTLFDLSKDIEDFRQQAFEENNLSAQAIIEQNKGFAIAELDNKFTQFSQEQQLRLKNYEEELSQRREQAKKSGEWTEQDEENYATLLKEARATLDNELLEAEAEYLDARLMLSDAFNNKLRNLEEKQLQEGFNAFRESRDATILAQQKFEEQSERTEVGRLRKQEEHRQENFEREKRYLNEEIALKKSQGEVTIALQEDLNRLEIENTQKTEEAKIAIRKASLERIASDIDKSKEYVQALADFIDADFEAQSQKEENKTNAINNELRARLSNENLSKEEKEKINQQIAANEEKLRIKQEAIEKKRFKTDKAFRISMALMDTASAALKAYASQLIVGDPSSIFRAQIAAAAATALGLAQVAMISKQQFQSSASSAPPSVGGTSGAGEAAPVQAPDFNVVGQSNVSQLAQLVQAQLEKPFKTYVVAKDVTTAQELDRNRVSAATI